MRIRNFCLCMIALCSILGGTTHAYHSSTGIAGGYYRSDGLFVGPTTRYTSYDYYNRSYSYDNYYDRYYDTNYYYDDYYYDDYRYYDDRYYRDDSYYGRNTCVREGGYAGGGISGTTYQCCSGLSRVEYMDGYAGADRGYTCIDIDGYCDDRYESSYNSRDCGSYNRSISDRGSYYYINVNNNSNGYTSSTNCTHKPSNSHWAAGCGYQPRCDWECDSGYRQDGNRCVRDDYEYCTQNIVCAYKNGNYRWYGTGCAASQDGASVVNNSYCEQTQNYCTNGATNYPYCNSCAYGQMFVNGRCSTTSTCQNKPYNATWNSGNGTYEPNCEWTCNSGYYRSGNTCVANSCSNGATNYPYCTTCPSGYTYQNGSCQYTPSICNNGATNYPYCNTCPSGQTYSNGYCTSDSYYWYTGSYGTCTASCGGGVQTRVVECRNQAGARVSESLCYGQQMPTVSQSCNTQTCNNPVNGVCGSSTYSCTAGYVSSTSESSTHYVWSCNGYNGGSNASCSTAKSTTTYSWIAGSYSSCVNGIQTRSVTCQNSSNQVVSDSYCSGTKPSSTQSCGNSYTYSWYTGSYGSTCSKTCGGGTKSRTVYCQRSDGTQVSDSYCSGSKPSATISCNEQACLQWYQNGGGQTCNQLCQSKGKRWVENDNWESCASGERRPQNTGITINYKFGTAGNTHTGGYNIWTYDGKYYCYGMNQTRDYDETDRVVACLCQ